MITLYFVQHGIALPKDVDEARPLSDIGEIETRNVAAKLKKKEIHINKIFHSGKLRAIQTAEIFSEILGVSKVSKLSGMSPKDDSKILIDQISDDGIMYVGHLPNLQKVVSTLVTNDQNNEVLRFRNSAVVCIEMEANKSVLKWYLTPELC